MTQNWDAKNYAQNFNFVPEYGRLLIDILAPQKGEKILDLGCGPGALTAEIAAKGCVVTGVDRDANMLEEARKAYPDITFLQRDGSNLGLDADFDAVFSNAALHWMNLDEVFPQVAKALRSGGRFVGEMGGCGNIASIEKAIYVALEGMGLRKADYPAAWRFYTTAEMAHKLERVGFEVRYTNLADRLSHLPEQTGGVVGWVKMFGGAITSKIPEARRDEFYHLVEQAARPALFRDGEWYADYRRFHFVGIKK